MKKNYKKLSKVICSLSIMIVSSFATAQTIDYEWGFGTGPSGASNESANGVCFDVDGNMYVTGTFRGSVDFDPSPNTVVLNGVNASLDPVLNSFILKFDSDSTLIWAKQFAGERNFAYDITYDGNESLYIVGGSRYATDFDTGSGIIYSGQSTDGVYLCKLDTAGAFQWVGYGTSTDFTEFNEVVYDAQNDQVVAAGQFNALDIDLYSGTDANSMTVTNNGGIDGLYAIYSSAGSLLNGGGIGGSNTDPLYDMKVNSQGDIYLAGRFQYTADLDPGANTDNHTSTGLVDGYLVKLNSSGDFIQSAVLQGSDNELIHSIEIDENDSLFVSGSYNGNAEIGNDWGGIAPVSFSTFGNYDAMILKMDEDFNVAWANSLGNTNSTGGEFITEMKYMDGNLYTGIVSSSAEVEFDFGSGSSVLSGEGDFDVFVSIYDQHANFIDVKGFGGTDRDYLEGLAVRSDGTIALAGYYESSSIDLDPTAGEDSYPNQGGTGREIYFSQMSYCGSVVDNTVTDDGTTITANEDAMQATYQWIDCSDDSEINGEMGVSYTPAQTGNYACIITNGCAVDTTNCTQITVGTNTLNENQFDEIKIYPNPVSDILNIESSSPISQVSILSVTGREMMKSRVQPEVINTSKLPSGVYFVKIYSKGQVSTRKLIKK